MDIFNAGMKPFIDKRLDRREVELRHLIDSTNEQRHEVDEAGPHGVVDFKDAAQKQALATTDEVMAKHGVQELEVVIAPRRRLADHDYGLCSDCGAAIDLGRLWPWPQRLLNHMPGHSRACRVPQARMTRLMRRTIALTALASASALSNVQSVSAKTRGQLLYNAHCIGCHTTQMYWRNWRAL